MSSIRKHSCVTVAPSVTRRVKLPRCVLASETNFRGVTKQPVAAHYTGTESKRTKSDGAADFRRSLVSSLGDRCGGDAKETSDRLSRGIKDSRRAAASNAGGGTNRSRLSSDRTITCPNEPSSDAPSGRHSAESSGNTAVATKEVPIFKENLQRSGVHEYFRNENFKSTGSIYNDRVNLDTINEAREPPDSIPTDGDLGTVPRRYPEAAGRQGGKLHDVKAFRERYYFECHSADAKLRQRASALRDERHRCRYGFYLDERLFPAPLHADHEHAARCSGCHLPVALAAGAGSADDAFNGTIQAKVTFGEDEKPRDVVLLLPVDAVLVTKRNRSVEDVSDENVVNFGVLKIDNRRGAICKSLVPEDSFALRYQKGYREFNSNNYFNYTTLKKENVILL